jgi:hypothetical protein
VKIRRTENAVAALTQASLYRLEGQTAAVAFHVDGWGSLHSEHAPS